MPSPFSFNFLGKAKTSAENSARQIAGRRVPNLGVKIPGQVFRNIPILGTTMPELIMRQAQGELPKELTFLLGDLLRSGPEVNHLEPERKSGNSDIESFITVLRQRNVVRSDRYVVTFNYPRVMAGASGVETLSLLCDEASLPAKTIHTRQAMFNALPEQRAHMIDFGGESINFRFLLDGNWEAKLFFDEWMNNIVDPFTREVSFYKDYVASVTITNLDTNNNQTMVTTLENAFPRVASAIPLSYTNKEVAYLNVTMTFKRWTLEMLNYGHHPSVQEVLNRPVRTPQIQNRLNQIMSITSQLR